MSRPGDGRLPGPRPCLAEHREQQAEREQYRHDRRGGDNALGRPVPQRVVHRVQDVGRPDRRE
jgi:hypothetical protein